jgi:hypothetical protein
MSLNSYLVTDEIRPLPGSGWTSKNAANIDDSKAKYKEKLNIPTGQKGYIDPSIFNLNAEFNKDKPDLINLKPKRSCVVEKPECVQYNYVIPEKYLKNGAKNAKIENQILENELDELQAQHGELQTAHNTLQEQRDLIQTELQATKEILSEIEINKNMTIYDLEDKLVNLEKLLEESQGLNQQQVDNFFNSNMFEAPTTPLQKLGGGTRHKKPRKRTKTQKRRTTRRLRSRKFPRKCFSLRKREK